MAVAGSLAAMVAVTGMPARAQEYYYYPPPYYAPPPSPPAYVYPPPYYYPPAVVVRPAPPVAAGAPPPQFWYWCDDPNGYYPNVPTCNRAWREVAASAAAPAGKNTQKPK